MLDQKTIEIIKSTVPVLEEHGEAITTRFYELMFGNHPELLNIFNHANQKQGRQQKALASAVYNAAKYIDNLEAIIPVVKQIGHKHRSLGITAEQYPIVGKHLLLAIKDVLGDAATDEIMNAWERAYGVIADAFISVEADMYNEAEQSHGGWKGFRKFIVDKKVKESDVITSFYLKPEDKQAISSFIPGQYISVKCSIDGEEYTHIRQYSLSDAPNKGHYRISVKRETGLGDIPDGKISNYLHDDVQKGDILNLSAPAGDFVLNTEVQNDVVLLSGGVGITPMVSMLNTIADTQPERKVTFIHAAINGNVHAMKDEVSAVTSKNEQISAYYSYNAPTVDDINNKAFDHEGFITLEWLQQIVHNTNADFYFCGPLPFMKTVYQLLKEIGVPQDNIHYEFFGPASDLEG
ncbi:NO-inducible flavohemoprotein [Cytobacillus sp. IB215316]|uniref:NO-inducible flavohemoprotein n=1 Tax=Cytobacillus sp. IB215316 TaxID=3097354 RepID=UPI002A0D441C|nr:NO-inducible flavohemoprotein [Cytobacillus sp. IB215316]MDX8361665.1 NO-inducible flavohemoprotein [Cytobacillus sp. IB215316]